MIIRRFFGFIILSIGALVLFVSGGCTVFGTTTIIGYLFTGKFNKIDDFFAVGLFTLAALAISFGMVKLGYYLCKRRDNE